MGELVEVELIPDGFTIAELIANNIKVCTTTIEQIEAAAADDGDDDGSKGLALSQQKERLVRLNKAAETAAKENADNRLYFVGKVLGG